MDGRRNESVVDLCLVFVQLDSFSFGSSNVFFLWDKRSSKNGKNELGKHAGKKGEDAKDEIEKLPDRGSLNGTINARSRGVSGIAPGGGSGLGSALARGQLFVDGRIWGGLT